MAFSVKLTQKTQTGGVNPVVATRSLLDDISSSASTISFDKTVSMSGNVTIGDGDSDSLLIVGGDIQTRNALQWTCKDNDLTSLRIGSSTVKDLINIDTHSTPNKVTIKNLQVMDNLTITDPLIKLGKDNETDDLDLGFYAQYNNGTTKYAGLFRDADDNGKFKLFKDLTTEPETTSVGSGYTAATLVVGSLEGNVTGNVTGNVSGSAATVTNATQSAITSVGTLTSVQVDNINIDGNTISSTTGTDLNIIPSTGQQIVLDGTIVVDAGVVTGATSITSTAFVGNVNGNVSGSSGSCTGNAETATTATTTDRINTSTPPSGASDTGTTGEIRYDDYYLYVCIDNDIWKRASLLTWP